MALGRYPAEGLTGEIIGAAIEVHRVLGPGLLESAYRTCLVHELTLRGLRLETETRIPLRYKGKQLDCGYRLDLVVEEAVLVELKAIESLLPIHEAQVLTYLRLRRLEVGLLLNFNVPVLRRGLRRIIQTQPQFSAASVPPR